MSITVAMEEVTAYNKHTNAHRYRAAHSEPYILSLEEYEFELNAPHRVLEIEAFHAGWVARDTIERKVERV